MKQNVSIPACEMENEGLEVTAKGAGAHYVYKAGQCPSHVSPLTKWQCREGACGCPCVVGQGRGRGVGSCVLKSSLKRISDLINAQMRTLLNSPGILYFLGP